MALRYLADPITGLNKLADQKMDLQYLMHIIKPFNLLDNSSVLLGCCKDIFTM